MLVHGSGSYDFTKSTQTHGLERKQSVFRGICHNLRWDPSSAIAPYLWFDRNAQKKVPQSRNGTISISEPESMEMKMPFDTQPEANTAAQPKRTMADVLTDLQKKEGKWKEYKRREMIGDVQSLEDKEKLGQPLSSIEADIDLLTARLDHIGWSAVGLNKPRWKNWRSNIRTAIDETGINRRTEGARRDAYPPAWDALFTAIEKAIKEGKEKEFRRVSLRTIASQAIKMGIDSPADVTQAVIDSLYADYFALHGRIESALGMRVKKRTRHFETAVVAWNKSWRQQNQKPWFSALPCVDLEKVGKPKRELYIQFGEMHPDLVRDIESAISEISGSNKPKGRRSSRFDGGTPDVPDGRKDRKGKRRGKLGTDAIAGLNVAARAVVTAAVKIAGRDLSDIRSLKGLMSFDAVVDTFDMFIDRSTARGVDASQMTSYSTFARNVGRFAVWAKLPEEDIDDLYENHIYHKAVRAKSRKLTPARRKMLRQFTQETAIEKWFEMPDRLWKRAEAARVKAQKEGRPIPAAAIADAECAAALATVGGVMPLRCANATWMRHKGPYQTLFLPTNPKDSGYISIPGSEVKNGVDLWAELDDQSLMIISGYLTLGYRNDFFHWNPKADRNSDFLFPGAHHAEIRDDFFWPGARTLGCISGGVADRFAEVGLEVEFHLGRHIVAKLMLDHDHGLLGTVADLLGDLVSTVRAYYIDGDTGRASNILKQIIVDRMRSMKSKWTRDIDHMKRAKEAARV